MFTRGLCTYVVLVWLFPLSTAIPVCGVPYERKGGETDRDAGEDGSSAAMQRSPETSAIPSSNSAYLGTVKVDRKQSSGYAVYSGAGCDQPEGTK